MQQIKRHQDWLFIFVNTNGAQCYITFICRRRSEYCRIIPEKKLTIFTEPEENNCFSITAQVLIRATAFSFILLVSSLKTSTNRAAAILKMSASVLFRTHKRSGYEISFSIIITSRGVVIALPSPHHYKSYCVMFLL